MHTIARKTTGWKRRFALLVLGVCLIGALLAAATKATIRPIDQRTAKDLTLQFGDFDQGWKITQRPSTRFRKTDCSSAPKFQSGITGFSDSAMFQEIDTGNVALSVSRVFPTRAKARAWFNWAAAGKAAVCQTNSEIAGWREDGYRVTGISRARESFPVDPDCGYIGAYAKRCYDRLGAWRIKFTVTKKNTSFDINYDYVVVNTGDLSDWRAVVAFHLFGGDYSLLEGGYLVEAVLGRVV